MTRRTPNTFAAVSIALCLLFSTIVLASLPGSARAADDKARLEKQSLEILQALKEFYPVRSSMSGVHEFDHRFTDYSDKSVRAMIKKLEGFDKNLKRFKEADLERGDWVDIKLLHSEVASALLDLKENATFKHSPQLYIDEAMFGLYALMITDSLVPQERLYPILKRFDACTGLFADAQRNLKSIPQLYVDYAIPRIESAQRFYQQCAGELMRQHPDRADEILAKSTRAREAMNDFGIFLSGTKIDEKFRVSPGAERYEEMLAARYFLNLKADTLVALLDGMLTRAQDDYEQYVTYVEDDHQTGKDSVYVPRSFNRADLLDYYQWEIDQVRIFVTETDLVSLGANGLKAVETPAFLREIVHGTAYQPRFQKGTDNPAFLFVRPVPSELDERQLAARYRYVHRRGFTPNVVHEAIPGKHLLIEQAANHESSVRRWHRNPFMIEGWALFCDQWAYEAGIHGSENPPVWLQVLNDIRLNTALAIADVRFNTGTMTFDECIDWLAATVFADTDAERQYLRRRLWTCVGSPGECLAPVIGKYEIERLRDAALAAEDKYYSDREFIDALLSQAAVPPSLMWEALDLGVADLAAR